MTRFQMLRRFCRVYPSVLPLLKIDHDIARQMRWRVLRNPKISFSAAQVNLLRRLKKEQS